MNQGTGYNPSAPPNLPVPPHVQAGPVYGLQAKQVWAPGEKDVRPMVDAQRAQKLWRVSVYGENVAITIAWGTQATKTIVGLLPPVLLTLPGQVTVSATPVPDALDVFEGAHCEVCLTPCSSPREGTARYFVGGTHVIPAEATRFMALTACQIQLGTHGPTINLTALEEVPLVNGSKLISGDGYVEFDT